MKQKIGFLALFIVLALTLTACGEVSFDEQNKSMPLDHVLGEEYSIDSANFCESVTLYGLSGTAALHSLSGKLYSFTFATNPGEGIVSQQYETLLNGLSEDYGKPSSTSDDGVALWSNKSLANTITLTSHAASSTTQGYVSLSFVGKFDALTALGLISQENNAEFEEETTLASLLDVTADQVTQTLGSATEVSLDDAGTGAMVYDGFTLGTMTGVLQVSFYEDRSYSATFSLSTLSYGDMCSPESYYTFVAKTRAAHKAPTQDYCLGYADDEGGVSQTQYQMWKNVKNKFTAELIYYTSPEGDVLQYGLTASWMLSNRPAMQAVMGD